MTTTPMRAGTGPLLVAEIFGPTFQGEGPSAGQQAAFLRLSRCNLTCVWCDTPYTWDWRRFDPTEQTLRLPAGEALARLLAVPAPLVVVTGGEPLLQQRRLLPVVAGCRAAGRQVEVETNGTVMASPALCAAVTRFNVSPKLANSRVELERRIRPDVLRGLAASGRAVFKFVVEGPGDLDEVAALAAEVGLGGGLAPVWVMPRGETTAGVLAVMRAVADEVLARGWNLTGRLQVLLWEAARGR